MNGKQKGSKCLPVKNHRYVISYGVDVQKNTRDPT